MTCQGTFQGIFQNVDNIGIFGGTFTNVYHEKTDLADPSNHLVRDILLALAGHSSRCDIM